MKQLFISICAILFINQAFTQTIISGFVQDQKGEVLISATCFLVKNKSKVTYVDFDGKFELSINENELIDTLEIRYLGYISKQIPVINLIENPLTIIVLKEEKNMMSEIVVSARNPISEDFSVKQLKPLDIYFNPMAKGDPLNAIQLLPASTDTEESASPSLRGSSPNRSIVVIDGVPIRNPVRYTQLNGVGSFSILSTDMLEKLSVYAGNPPLTYGNTSAGLVDIKLATQGPNDGFNVGVGLASVSAKWTKNFKESNGFVSVFGNQSFSQIYKAFNKNNVPNLNDFQNSDFGIRLFSKLNKKINLSFFNYSSIESYDVNFNLFSYDGNAIADQKRNFTVATFDWGNLENRWTFNNGFDMTESDFNYGLIKSFVQRKDFYSALNYKRNGSSYVVQTGLNYRWSSDKFKEQQSQNYFALDDQYPSFKSDTLLRQHDLQAYIYGKIYVGSFTFSAAIRNNITIDDQLSFLSYQTAVRFAPNKKHSLLLSQGRYHNYNYPTSQERHLKLMQSEQVALEYQFNSPNFDVTFAAYFKKESDDKGLHLETDNYIPGTRKIRGIEISASKKIGDRIKIDLANTFVDVNIEGKKSDYRASNDLNYFMKMGITYFNNDVFNVGLSYLGRPGKYYTNIVGAQRINNDLYRPQFSNKINGSQYESYNNASLTFNRLIDLKNKKTLILYFVLNNIFNIKNQQRAIYNNDYSIKEFEYYGQRWVYFGGMIEL